MNVKEFFEQAKYRDPDRLNVAAALRNGNELHYAESDNPRLPAAVSLLSNSLTSSRDILTNLPKKHWLRTYVRNVRPAGNYTSNKKDRSTQDVDTIAIAPQLWPGTVEGPTIAAPLKRGGLYDAARTAATRGKPLDDAKSASVEEKLLRYYMLTAYSLLDRCSAHKGLNNFVSALLVNDSGQILSAGLNMGDGYRHAEVSMLLSYFLKNKAARSFPTRTIVFSTLTPCTQCTEYLKEAKPADSIIYFGQEDTGKDGRAGKKISAALSEVTKAPQGRTEKPASASADPEPEVAEDLRGSGVAALPTASEVHKVKIANGLSGCMDSGKGNVAKQIGESKDALDILKSASGALDHKIGKDRDDDVKRQVLVYLRDWLAGVKL